MKNSKYKYDSVLDELYKTREEIAKESGYNFLVSIEKVNDTFIAFLKDNNLRLVASKDGGKKMQKMAVKEKKKRTVKV